MPKSVLDAIRLGQWDFEPRTSEDDEYIPTNAMPGTQEKILAMAERIRSGLPLWHPRDRDDLEAPPPLRIGKPR